MKALYYWIIVFVFVLFTTVIGLFMFPFITWLSNFDELFIVLLSLGGVLLILSIIFFRLRRKNEYKLSAMIAFPFALTFLIGGGIHYARFEDDAYRIGNCLKCHGCLYSKFGVSIIGGYTTWVSGSLNGEQVLLSGYVYDHQIGRQMVYNRDSQGEIRCYNGDLSTNECDKYEVTYKMMICDKNGNYYGTIDGKFYYTQNYQSSEEYRYEFYETLTGREFASSFYCSIDNSLMRDEIIAQSGNQLSY